MSGDDKKQRNPWSATKVADELKGAAEKIDRIERLGAADGVVTFKERLALRGLRRSIEDLEETYRMAPGLRMDSQDGADGRAD